MNAIRLETMNLAIGYHNRERRPAVVSGLNLHLNSGRLTCLIGPNGTGKSTLLRTLAGLQRPLDGQILLDGRLVERIPAEERARKISVVLTDAAHPGDLRVEQVVELGRLPYTNWLGALSEQDRRAVGWAMDQANAAGLAERNFGELSDGERQKVMVARALAQEPAVMILDEPTAFLDWSNRVDLLVNLKRIAAKEDRAILISSHDLELVFQIADEIWLLDRDRKMETGTGRELLDNGSLERTFTGRYAHFLAGPGRIEVS